MLVCSNASDEIKFCQRVFGAVELSRRKAKDGSVIHATLKINESLIMIHNESSHLASRAPQPDGSSSVVIYLYGEEEVDIVIERAVAEGARVLLPPEDQAWGDRVGRIVDLSGHVWNIATRILKE
ncbi:VOC family protein [Aliifodinibius salicampi]|uniref:VOC family protein n=1 Tax=Fodinibius salicampi TaxID=1920655 RepID=A0ABT3Q2Z5_9BACT|nr:VOC family protein [Fodinibius salicampi]MCW9714489.1 VOC family protein [Fodinibius salicampi]